MQFRCSKNELSKAIAVAGRAIAKVQRTIMDCILFETQDNMVVLKATDGQMSIRTRVIAQIETPGRIAVPARILAEFVSHLPNAEVTMKQIAENTVEVRCEAAKSRIQLMNADEFPTLPEVSGTAAVTVPTDQFKDMVSRTAFAVASTEDRPILTGILFHLGRESLRMVAVDGYRMAICKEPAVCEVDGDYLVPARALRELCRSLGDEHSDLTICFEGGRALFRTDFMQVITSLIEGDYVPYESFFPDTYATHVGVDRETLCKCVERADIIARQLSSPVIKLTLKEGELDIQADAQTASSSEPIPVVKRGADITIALNSRYLLDVLHAVYDPEITLMFNTPTTPCVVERQGIESYHYLILPVQIQRAS